jgi:hypothetical protein
MRLIFRTTDEKAALGRHKRIIVFCSDCESLILRI